MQLVLLTSKLHNRMSQLMFCAKYAKSRKLHFSSTQSVFSNSALCKTRQKLVVCSMWYYTGAPDKVPRPYILRIYVTIESLWTPLFLAWKRKLNLLNLSILQVWSIYGVGVVTQTPPIFFSAAGYTFLMEFDRPLNYDYDLLF